MFWAADAHNPGKIARWKTSWRKLEVHITLESIVWTACYRRTPVYTLTIQLTAILQVITEYFNHSKKHYTNKSCKCGTAILPKIWQVSGSVSPSVSWSSEGAGKKVFVTRAYGSNPFPLSFSLDVFVKVRLLTLVPQVLTFAFHNQSDLSLVYLVNYQHHSLTRTSGI